MERLGKISEWHDNRGFGFVAPVGDDAANGRVFFHIRDYDQGLRRPEVGELVKFSASKQGDGRWRASRVRRAVASPRANATATKPRKATARPVRHLAPAWSLVLLVLAYACAVALAVEHERLPMELVFWFVAANGITLLFYYGDKVAAQRGESRTSESTLHALEFVGGWPCALLAQRLFRHKTTKASYRAGFWTAVVLHIVVVAGLAYGRVLG